MAYHIEEIYKLAGRERRIAVIEFIEETESFNLYGPSITVLFSYTQFENERLEREHAAGSASLTHGKVKAKFLTGAELSDELQIKMFKEGINTGDIEVLYIGWDSENLFYEEKVREIKTMSIPMRVEPKGGDYNWLYGLSLRKLSKGLIFNPHDREWYLAMKYFFDPKEFNEEETQEAFGEDGKLRPGVEYKFLELKIDREVNSKEELDRFSELAKEFAAENYAILLKEFANANATIKKIAVQNYPLLQHLVKGTYLFSPRNLNVVGKRPIYLDWKGFLHVFLRHVNEFEVGANFSSKSKFLWTPNNVIMVMQKVIESIDEEIQAYWEEHPGNRYARFGEKTVYFEGDYYTVQIEENGRIDTFHPSDKRI